MRQIIAEGADMEFAVRLIIGLLAEWSFIFNNSPFESVGGMVKLLINFEKGKAPSVTVIKEITKAFDKIEG